MNIGDVVLGLASIAIGYSQLKKGVAAITPKDKTNLGGTSVRRIQKGQYFTLSGAPMGKSAAEGTMKIRGVNNLDERMSAIIEMSRRGKIEPSVMAWARAQVTKRCRQGRNGEQWCTPEKDTMAEIAAIYQGLRSDVRYTSDIRGFDTYVNPKHTLAQQAGDCDDYASLGVAALNSIGIPARYKVIRTHGSPDWDHIYIQAGTPKDDPTRWISLDASVPMQAGWEAPAHMIADSRVYETE